MAFETAIFSPIVNTISDRIIDVSQETMFCNDFRISDTGSTDKSNALKCDSIYKIDMLF